MRGWWAMFGPKFIVQHKQEQKQLLEEWSGRIPILLRELVRIQGSLADSNAPQVAQGGNTGSHATLPPVSAGPSRSARIPRTPATEIIPHGPENTPEGSAGSSNDPEAIYQGLADELFERFQCSAAVNDMRLNISRFYGHYKHKLKHAQPSAWARYLLPPKRNPQNR